MFKPNPRMKPLGWICETQVILLVQIFKFKVGPEYKVPKLKTWFSLAQTFNMDQIGLICCILNISCPSHTGLASPASAGPSLDGGSHP